MTERHYAINPALTETVTAFDPQMELGGPMNGNSTVPTGIRYSADGKTAFLSFTAPAAKQVVVHRGVSNGPVTELHRQENGIWTGELESNGEKYTTLFYEVDGVYVLNPMSGIGWSHAHPINIIDFVQDDIEYYLLQDVPHGTVNHDRYYSKTCGCHKGCLVYTPPGYQKGEYHDLPVLYLQHGYGENESSWVFLGKVNYIMDNLLAQGKAMPCIIVMNNGMVQTLHEDGTRDWNPSTIERLLIDDCIPYIEKNYRVATDKWNRAMAGLSMGSMQTSIVTLKNPDIFGYAGIFSGFLGMPAGLGDGMNEHMEAFSDKDKILESYRLFFRSIGDQDGFIATYHQETEMLQEKGLLSGDWKAYQQVIYPGGHDWNVWRPTVRDFLSQVFR